jgi:CheY-like chemotaxis protein
MGESTRLLPTVGRVASTILIVDDDPGVVASFARMLQLEGFTVHTATTADTGLRQVLTVQPDAILLDLRMPRVDGLDFLRRLRQQEPRRDTPVAIVTGDYFLDDSVSAEIRQLGAAVTFKPLWLEDLVTLAQTLVTDRTKGSAIAPPIDRPAHGNTP